MPFDVFLHIPPDEKLGFDGYEDWNRISFIPRQGEILHFWPLASEHVLSCRVEQVEYTSWESLPEGDAIFIGLTFIERKSVPPDIRRMYEEGPFRMSDGRSEGGG